MSGLLAGLFPGESIVAVSDEASVFTVSWSNRLSAVSFFPSALLLLCEDERRFSFFSFFLLFLDFASASSSAAESNPET